MTSKRSTTGAYDLGMGDSSVRVEDAGDLRVRQAMIARPKSVSRDASVGEARILFENPKNRLLLVSTTTASTSGHVLREDVPESEPDEAPLLSHVRRDCPHDRARRQRRRRRCRWRATASTTGSWWSARTGGSRACSASTSATATSAWTCAGDGSPPQRADARRLPAARRVPASRRASRSCTRTAGGSPTASSRSAATGSRTRCATAGCSTAIASRCCRRTRRRSSRRTTRVPLAGGVLVAINTRLAPAEIDAHPAPLGRAHAARRPRARAAASSRSTCGGIDVVRVDDSGRAGRSLRAAARLRRARAARELARARGGADLDQLHLGHDRRAQGRRLHAPRRVPERARRGDRGRASRRDSAYLWTLPMFHCNGWCFPWAVTAVAGAPRDRARGRPGPRLGADRARGRDALQRRADGAHRRRRPPVGAPARAARDGARRPPRRPRRRCSRASRSSTSASSTSTG